MQQPDSSLPVPVDLSSALVGEYAVRIAISDQALQAGSQSVMQELIPGTMSIIAHSAKLGIQETVRRLGNRIQTIRSIDRLGQLELGHILWFFRHEKIWQKLPGAGNWKSWRQWVECSGILPLSYARVEDCIRFYELFCRCVDAHLSPDPLLAPQEMTPYKRGLIEQQIEEMEGKIAGLQVGEQQLEAAARTIRSSVSHEIERIVETPDGELQLQELNRSYPPVEEEMHPLNLYVHVHLQGDGLILDHGMIPLTEEAFAAWKAGAINCRYQLAGVPDAMTLGELEAYLRDNDLFVEDPNVVDADDDIDI